MTAANALSGMQEKAREVLLIDGVSDPMKFAKESAAFMLQHGRLVPGLINLLNSLIASNADGTFREYRLMSKVDRSHVLLDRVITSAGKSLPEELVIEILAEISPPRGVSHG